MDARGVKSALLKKGFVERDRGHKFYHLYANGRKTPIYTKLGHGAKEIDDGLVSAMARQLRLTTGEFRALVGCEMDGATYASQLRHGGHIE